MAIPEPILNSDPYIWKPKPKIFQCPKDNLGGQMVLDRYTQVILCCIIMNLRMAQLISLFPTTPPPQSALHSPPNLHSPPFTSCAYNHNIPLELLLILWSPLSTTLFCTPCPSHSGSCAMGIFSLAHSKTFWVITYGFNNAQLGEDCCFYQPP